MSYNKIHWHDDWETLNAIEIRNKMKDNFILWSNWRTSQNKFWSDFTITDIIWGYYGERLRASDQHRFWGLQFLVEFALWILNEKISVQVDTALVRTSPIIIKYNFINDVMDFKTSVVIWIEESLVRIKFLPTGLFLFFYLQLCRMK